MIKQVLTIGLLDKDTKQQKYDIITAYKLIEQECKNNALDYTIYEAQGSYTHDDGTRIHEPSLRVEFYFVSKERIFELAKELKKILNQETIAYECLQIESELI